MTRASALLLRASASAAVFASVLVVPAAANADVEACSKAYEEGQRLRRDDKLLESRRELVTCAQDACPAVLRKDCVGWLGEVERAIPSVAIQVRGADGCDRAAARVLVDNIAAPSDGRAAELNPGTHALRVELDGNVRTLNIVATAGEGSRVVRVSFAESNVVCGAPSVAPGGPVSLVAPPERPAEPRRPIPTAAYALGGAGIVALGIGAGFGISAWSQKGTLDDCKGSCARDDVNAMERAFIVSDVTIGLGLASLAAATILTLLR